jgi:hypothetical protein
MGAMAQIARLAVFVLGFVMVVLTYVFDWFTIGGAPVDLHVTLNPIPVRGSSGLVVTVCDTCPAAYTGRLPGGMAWLASMVAVQFAAALLASGWQVLKGYRHPGITAWTTISAIVLGILTVIVLGTFEVPRGFTLDTGLGAYAALLACALALIGHSRLPDRLDLD